MQHDHGDIKPQIYWGHDLDFLRSCDVIGHLTIGLAICDFLYVVIASYSTSIRYGYRDIKPQTLDT